MKKNAPEDLIKKAQKELEPGFFKSIFSDAGERVEKAIGYYKEAAEQYKIKREWIKAGDCFIEIANLKEGIKDDPIESYHDAILCYNKGGAKDKYSKLTNKIINLYVDNGQFTLAADLVYEKAQKILSKQKINEIEPKKLDKLLNLYNKALDYIQMDKNTKESKSIEIKESKADLITLNGIKDEIPQAKFYYEEIAEYYSKSNSGKVFCKDYYSKIIFLYLAYDEYVTAKAFLNKYYDKDNSLYGSTIGNFLENIILCFENDGMDIKEDIGTEDEPFNFEKAVSLYKEKINYNKKIWDNWKEIMVDKIRKKLQKIKDEKEKENELEEEDDYK